MRATKCKCGQKEWFGSMFPPCSRCDECGSAPFGDEPTQHRFSKQYDQKTGKPYNFCMVCGKREQINAE